MKNKMQKIMVWIRSHKIWSVVLLIGILVLGYGISKAMGGEALGTRYVLAAAERGTIVSTVTGTGQVSASDQVDVTAGVSGELVYLNAKAGQTVSTGTLLGQIDASDAQYELETALLSYQELVTIDESELRDLELALTNAEEDLEESYVSARAELIAGSTDMGDILMDIKSILDGYLNVSSGYSVSKVLVEHIDRAEDAYYVADKAFDVLMDQYETLSVKTPKEDIENMVEESYEAAILIAQAAKSTQDAIVYKKDREDTETAEAEEAYTTILGAVSSVNGLVNTLASTKSNLVNAKRTVVNAEYNLEDLKAGPDQLELRTEELSLKQKEDAVMDYAIRAPFDGIIASVAAKKGDNLSNGATVATLITKQKVAEISLNEIDAAKVEVGQKATLTFDVFEDIMLDAQIAEVDLLGTVSQGVVNYTVKIAFESDDDRIKPGMTVTANIITDTEENVVVVPLSAVKTQGNKSYIETVSSRTPQNGPMVPQDIAASSIIRTEVTTGLSNDESIAIMSGLEAGQQYVVRTITDTTQQAAVQSGAPSLFGSGRTTTGRSGGGGVMIRQ